MSWPQIDCRECGTRVNLKRRVRKRGYITTYECQKCGAHNSIRTNTYGNAGASRGVAA